MVHGCQLTTQTKPLRLPLRCSCPVNATAIRAAFLRLRPGALLKGCRAVVLFGGGCL